MKITELQSLISRGEDSTCQFKVNVRNPESLAAEMAAFANSEGGTIYIGVADDGGTPGLSRPEVARINQLISNAASQLVKSPLTVRTENIALENGRLLIVLTVPKGIDKPYFDRNGVIWLKTGSDKRRVNSKEELRRPFQMTDQFHADELPTKAGIDKLDKLRFRDFLRDYYQQEYPDDPSALTQLLQNMNLVVDDGMLNLTGVLLFAERPEIPETVFEELLVNALVHRDYFVSAPVRLFIFDNRTEIVSPGHLPNNLTVEKIRTGNSNIRNPILVSYAAKGLVPYHGLGSGIKRALEAWPLLDFSDDRDGCLFTVTVHRKSVEELVLLDKGALKKQIKGRDAPINAAITGIQTQLLDLIRVNPSISYDELAVLTQKDRSTIMRNIRKLKDIGRLKRVGSKKTGHWEALE